MWADKPCPWCQPGRFAHTSSKKEWIPLITAFHPNLPSLHMITRSLLPVLHVSSHLYNAIPEPPVIGFKRPKNLRDLLVSAQLKPTEFDPARGTTACGSSRCLTCQHVKTEILVQSTSTGQSFKVWATTTCKTGNVIYSIQYNLCQYNYMWVRQKILSIFAWMPIAMTSDIRKMTNLLELTFQVLFTHPKTSKSWYWRRWGVRAISWENIKKAFGRIQPRTMNVPTIHLSFFLFPFFILYYWRAGAS